MLNAMLTTEEILHYFYEETNEPDTWVWREDLTPEQAAMVAEWDKQVEQGFANLINALYKQLGV